MPFPDAAFDFVVCTAAFKNFSDPLGALNEIHRVLAPGGEASIYDLRKDASQDEIARGVRSMQLSPINALLTRLIFRFGLLRSAYSREALEQLLEPASSSPMVSASSCGLRPREALVTRATPHPRLRATCAGLP